MNQGRPNKAAIMHLNFQNYTYQPHGYDLSNFTSHKYKSKSYSRLPQMEFGHFICNWTL